MSKNIKYGRTTVFWDINRQAWAMPGRQITKDKYKAQRAAIIINRITEGLR